MLADGLRNMKGLLEENADEAGWLQDIVKELGFSSPSIALKRCVEQLELGRGERRLTRQVGGAGRGNHAEGRRERRFSP